MASPVATVSLLSISIINPSVVPLVPRQPPAVLVGANIDAYLGLPSSTASPLRWQRSSGCKPVINGGCQYGSKLKLLSSQARQLNIVFTSSSLSFTHTIS